MPEIAAARTDTMYRSGTDTNQEQEFIGFWIEMNAIGGHGIGKYILTEYRQVQTNNHCYMRPYSF